MAALINFLTADGLYVISDLSGSGLGFYGSSFGASVQVGSYQDKTFVTNSNGTLQGPESWNIKFTNSASGYVGGASSGIALTAIPNRQATLQIRFSYQDAVKVQNAKAYIYDRVSINNPASGVTCKAAQLIHPTAAQDNDGSGSTSWTTMSGTGAYLTLANSPGVSGLYAGNGSNSTRSDQVHDFYLAISASPDSIGSKTQFGLFCSLEYL
jgi:hypothetical protein